MSAIQWDNSLIEKYNINGPRYTSYPTALALSEPFPVVKVNNALTDSNDPLSLYIHLPFCVKLCYYCGCNKVITRHQGKADKYLDYLEQEIQQYAQIIQQRRVRHLHLGGGTPTFLDETQLTRLMDMLKKHARLEVSDAHEISIEIDPRSCSLDKLAHLRKLGFNRVSFGVQDFDERVQIAINRVQEEPMIRALVAESKKLGFTSINLDLVYGLPHQSRESFQYTLNKVIELDPDRISLFSYAHLPGRFSAQRKIKDSWLPQAADKLGLLQDGIEAFTGAGYQFIGMDHFAKPDDELAIAQREGRLQRNFQGYTTHGSDCLLGLGVSSISQINGVIWQNVKELPDYYKKVGAGILPVVKGVELSADDETRAALIAQVICHFTLDIPAFEQQQNLDFFSYFSEAIERLQPFTEDGLVEINENRLSVTPAGRLWVRSICSAFDAYLHDGQQRYSKVV